MFFHRLLKTFLLWLFILVIIFGFDVKLGFIVQNLGERRDYVLVLKK